ncbi:DUF3618 domain-containing protein [Micromonospora sp. KC606]|uniref:DUF3618 domain-containing protein n=1 Tax=Micromonospora sp. KC606 TaxID=2530379 RepID=UPI0010451507|nr:DUF3618 domain-containing protein [Micromonospora sp. KC606]TDC85076.1 DUF3618 domain-containing protein [Micromonospora sp. KC606]
MSTDPDRIRHDIETTRAALSNDVDALAYKADPRRIAAVPVTRVRSRFSRLVDDVMGTARHAGRSTRQQGADMGHRVSGAAHRGADVAAGAAHRGADMAAGAAHRGADMAAGAAHQTSAAVSSAGHQAQALGHASRERAEGNPLAAGLVAFGVGLLTASLLPPSRKEHDLAERAKHTAMQHSGELKQRASGVMHQMQENLREPAQHAAETVRTTAASGAHAVADTGRAEAQHVRDDVREAPRRL